MNHRTERVPRPRLRLANLIGLGILVVAVIVTIVIAQSVALAAASSDGASAAPLSEADGAISEDDAVSVFSDTPALTNLDPELLAAVRAAAKAAEQDDVRMQVNSGWRSPALQSALLADAVVEFGSAEEARRWVATPENSEHVAGRAVDLGPLPAQDWLATHGAEFGLCQVYANERWHFELRPSAPANGCPLMYEDPTADPRTQR